MIPFDFEPSGINDTYLRLCRNDAACILAPGGAWNGLLRLNHITAGVPSGSEPFLVFRVIDVGWDDGRFTWTGKARPVAISAAMTDVLVERGMVTDAEAERMLFNTPEEHSGRSTDSALMVRGMIAGCSFSPIYDSRPLASDPPKVIGFALRTLADPNAFMLDADAGLPVLTAEARAALMRHFRP